MRITREMVKSGVKFAGKAAGAIGFLFGTQLVADALTEKAESTQLYKEVVKPKREEVQVMGFMCE